MKRIPLVAFVLLSIVPCFGSSDSVVVFSEIMYHPAETDGPEWVELHNQMAVDIDLSGWRLDGGVGFAFAEGTIIEGGGFVVVATNPEAVPGSLGPLEGRLDNNGEILRLYSNSDRLMNEVRYGDDAPWPAAADGSGASLALVHRDSTPTKVTNWSWSHENGGTPGAANFSNNTIPDTDIVLNELSGGDEEPFSVELFHSGSAPVSLDGFVIGVSGDPLQEAALPERNLDPGQFVSFTAEELGLTISRGERLFLYTPDKAAVLDGVVIKTRPRGRFPDGNGDWMFVDELTAGSPNQVTLTDTLVINEILYHHHPQFEHEGIYGDTTVTPASDPWRYYDQGSLPSDWFMQSHTDWPSGNGPLGVTPNPNALPEAPATAVALGSLTHYFEREFEIVGEPAGTTFEWRHLVDDGAVFYVNGQEAFRINMPEGEVSSSTRALEAIENANYSEWMTIPAGLLQAGTNRLSVEIHQFAILSNDVIFGLELRGRETIEPAVNFAESNEEWIELYNRGDAPIDLTGWKVNGDADYDFPDGTILDADAYLVVARDAASVQAKYPDITVLGDWRGNLPNNSGEIILEDASGNPADHVRYYQGGRWPRSADGGGSSLELIDPRIDNAIGEAWSPSDTLSSTEWRQYAYRGEAARSAVGPDSQWPDFVLGLLQAGEILIDDIQVIKDPDGEARSIVSNGSFRSSIFGGGPLRGWRLLGNHRWGEAIPDPDDPDNTVLHIVSDGATEHMHNHIETTMTERVENGTEYEISFRARYVNGSPRLHTRLYFNRLALDQVIDLPSSVGTPGSPNSQLVANGGPTFSGLKHSPPVPKPEDATTISVYAKDPDGIETVNLYWSVEGGAFSTKAMTSDTDDHWTAEIPKLEEGNVVQFYVEAVDSLGAASFMPAGGPESRALYQVDDGRAATNGLHNFRIIQTPEDEEWLHETINLMSNARVPCTVIYREQEIYYDIGVRLKGSERGRTTQPRLGFNVKFHGDQPFRGIHRSVAIDRSESTGYGQREILINQIAVHSGKIPAEMNDLIQIIPAREIYTGAAELQLARYGSIFLDSQFENGSEGHLYEYELIYYPTTDDANGYKRPQPDTVVAAPWRDIGDDEENYRWNFLTKNNRERDDFRPIMNYVKMWSLNGAEFEQRLEELVDVDGWLRGMAIATMSGAGDQYAAGSAHNGQFYIKPDGKAIFFPHDVDAFHNASLSITQNAELRRIIDIPRYERAYLAHLTDILASTHNPSYLERWADHYGSLLPGQNFAGHLSFMTQRTNFVRNQVNRMAPKVIFSITSNGGEDFSVTTPTVTLKGQGWVNIGSVRHVETGLELQPEWLDLENWQLTLPLEAGANVITLQALDHQGTVGSIFSPVGNDSITITNNSGLEPATANNLVISEIMFHPATPTEAERAAGFTDANDFEYLEFRNIGNVAVDLSGVQLTDGVQFALSGTIAPGEHVLTVRNLEAFRLRHGESGTVLGAWNSARLSNEGERIVLAREGGEELHSFRYDVGDPWPIEASGTGASLELINPDTNPDPSEPASWKASVSGGTPGSSGSAIPNESYATWVEAQFTPTESQDPTISGEQADPDGDGLTNYGEFVFLGDPKRRDAKGILHLERISNTKLVLSYTRRKGTGARFSIEEADLLTTWTAIEGLEESVTPVNDLSESVSLNLSQSQSTEFFRLHVFQ